MAGTERRVLPGKGFDILEWPTIFRSVTGAFLYVYQLVGFYVIRILLSSAMLSSYWERWILFAFELYRI